MAGLHADLYYRLLENGIPDKVVEAVFYGYPSRKDTSTLELLQAQELRERLINGYESAVRTFIYKKHYEIGLNPANE